MKKTVLSMLALFFGIGAYAQFAESNSPSIGDHLTLFLLDSNATAYDAEVGSNAVWDYSTTTGYNGETRELKISDAADTSAGGTFSTSTEAFDIEDFFISYMTKDASKKESQGFIFNAEGIDAGIVIAKIFDTVPELLFTYPFNIGSVATSDFGGVVTLDLGGGPLDVGLVGNSYTTVDGEGTLKLATNDYSNVLRYKLVDTMGIILDTITNQDPDVQIVRVQYEYYKHDLSNLPIFTYTDVAFKYVGDTVNIGRLTIVLGLDNPTASLSKNVLQATKIYPNPTDSKLNIQLPSSVEFANIVVTDAQGREVLKSAVRSTEKPIDVAFLTDGIYFVNISNNKNTVTKSFVIR